MDCCLHYRKNQEYRVWWIMSKKTSFVYFTLTKGSVPKIIYWYCTTYLLIVKELDQIKCLRRYGYDKQCQLTALLFIAKAANFSSRLVLLKNKNYHARIVWAKWCQLGEVMLQSAHNATMYNIHRTTSGWCPLVSEEEGIPSKCIRQQWSWCPLLYLWRPSAPRLIATIWRLS